MTVKVELIVIGPADKPLLPAVTVTFSAIVLELYAIALVAAEPKYCPPATTAVVTAVTKPLALTVTIGIAVLEPNEPMLLFTVANVNALAPAVLVASPVNAGSLAAGKVPLEILLALVVSVVAEATNPKLVLAVDTETRSLRLLAFKREEANVLVALAAEFEADVAELAALVADVLALPAEVAAALAEPEAAVALAAAASASA